MADTKISALTTDSAPDRTADYSPTYDASAVATKKVLLSNFGGYYITLFGASFSPADSTTYYTGAAGGSTGAVAANNRVYIPRAGKLVKVRIFITCTVGTSETSTLSFRLNDTTDTTIVSTVALNATPYTSVNSALSVAVAEDDWFTIKWVTPAWVTNPTAVIPVFQLWFT